MSHRLSLGFSVRRLALVGAAIVAMIVVAEGATTTARATVPVRWTPPGVVPAGFVPQSFTLPDSLFGAHSSADGITSGPDGALWFTTPGGEIGRVTTAGSFTRVSDPEAPIRTVRAARVS